MNRIKLPFLISLVLSFFLSSINCQNIDVADSIKISSLAYAVENIGSETEAIFTLVRKVDHDIAPSQKILDEEKDIYDVIANVNILRSTTTIDSLHNLSYKEADEVAIKVSEYKKSLNSYKESLVGSTGNLRDYIVQITEFLKKWKFTYEVAIKEGRSEKLINQINQNIRLLQEQEKKINNVQNEILNLQSDITGVFVYLDELELELVEVQSLLKGNILALDSPPFWRNIISSTDSLSRTYDAKVIVSRKIKEVKFDVRDNISGLIAFAVFLFLVYIGLIYLRAKLLKEGFTDYNQYVSSILILLKSPFALSLLICLLFAEMFISSMPTSIIIGLTILYTIPMGYTVPSLINIIPKRFFYIFLFYMLSRMTNIFTSNLPLLNQVNVLFQCALGMFLSSWMYNLIKHKHIDLTKGRLKILRFFVKLSFFGFFISFSLAFLGNTGLATLLLDGFFKMIFGAVLISSTSTVFINLFGVGIKYGHKIHSNILVEYPSLIINKVRKYIHIFAFIYWVYYSLDNFHIYEDVYSWIVEVLTAGTSVGNMSISLGSILSFFITLLISFNISKFIRFVLNDEVFTHFKMPRGVPGAISMIIRLIIISIGFLVAFAVANIDVSNITIIFGALGVGIGFGLQNIFNNLVSGLILAFERPIQVGDTIQLDNLNLMGEVKEIGIRASTVRTFDGAEVIVPNGNLISNEMVNWTLSDATRRQKIEVGVAYGSDLNKVIEILSGLLLDEHVSGIMKTPQPRVLFDGYGDSSINFKLLFWTSFDQGLATTSAVGVAINDAFNKEGIVIPFPQRDLHIIRASDDTKDIDITRDIDH